MNANRECQNVRRQQMDSIEHPEWLIEIEAVAVLGG